MEKSYKVGKMLPGWHDNYAQTITFIVTEDCNLRCKYCYITHKALNKKMNLETAKKFIDYILTANIHYAKAVIIEFIGGEPFIETKLVDQISDYFKIQTYLHHHPWYWNYRFSFSTNGAGRRELLRSLQMWFLKMFGKNTMTKSLKTNSDHWPIIL